MIWREGTLRSLNTEWKNTFKYMYFERMLKTKCLYFGSCYYTIESILWLFVIQILLQIILTLLMDA